MSNSNPVNTDSYLVKLKSLGLSDQKIAAKLGISVEEVRTRWQAILRMSQDQIVNGYSGLCESFNLLAAQYRLVGESLKVLGGAMGDVMTESEIRALVRENPEETVQNFLRFAIVLRVFTPPPASGESPSLPNPAHPDRN